MNNDHSIITNPDELAVQELESAVITCLLNHTYTLPEVASWLTPEMFFCPEAAFIYQAILNQYNRGEKPDYLTTETEMRKIDNPLFQKTGGTAWLGDTLHAIRHTDNLPAYAAEIKRNHLLRSLNSLFTTLKGQTLLTATDPLSLINDADRALLDIRQQMKQNEGLRSLGTLGPKIVDIHRERSQKPMADYTICSGFADLDALFGGFQRGELHVLAGRPAEGKTAISLQIGRNVAYSGKPVCFFSLEMNDFPVVNRLLGGQTAVHPTRLRMSNLREEDFRQIEQVAQEWKDIPFYLDYTPGNTIENIRAQTLLAKKQHGCDMAIVDYLGLMGGKPLRGENQEQRVARNIIALKQLALEADCVVMVISQMNRACENRSEDHNRPLLSDLRDSGVVEQAADGVTFVYRPDKHKLTSDPETGKSLEGICQLIVRKNRHGITGTVDLQHNRSFTAFTNL